MKKDNKQAFYDEFRSLLTEAPTALEALRNKTGKFGIDDIAPLEEKNWDEECWASWAVLISIMGMIQWGKTKNELDDEVLKTFSPMMPFEGKVETGKWADLEDSHTFDKMTAAFPDLKGKWERISPDEKRDIMGKPCDPT